MRQSKHEVMIWAAGGDGQLKQDGFGHKYDLKAEVEAGRGSTYMVNPTAYGVYREGGGLAPTMRLIEFPDGVTGLASNHYLWSWAAQAKSDWTFHDSTHWTDSHEGTFGELWLHHFYSVYDDATEAWAQTTYKLPPEPWFAVRLWRGEQNPEDWPLASNPPYSYIEFGKEFRLFIPYGGNLQLYIAASDGWVELKPETGDGLAGFEGTGDEAKIIHVGVLRGRVMLSYDNFGSGTVFYRIPLGDSYDGHALRYTRYWAADGRIDAPRVWMSEVKVGHFGGECGFTFFPMRAFRDAANPNQFAYPYVPIGYYHAQNPSGIVADVWWERARGHWNDDTDFEAADAYTYIKPSVIVDTSKETAANITLKWVPELWTDGNLTTTMTPAVYAAQLRQPPNVSGTTEKSSTLLSPNPVGSVDRIRVQEITVEEAEEFSPAFVRIRISDTGSALTTELKDFQRIRVKLGEKVGASSNTATVFDGQIRNPRFRTERGAGRLITGELYAFDDVRGLVDSRYEGREPDLELLSVGEAAQWLGRAAGMKAARIVPSTVHYSMMLHGGTRTSQTWGYSIEGYNGQRRWEPQYGAEFLPTFRDIAVAANNSQWRWKAASRVVELTNGYWTTTGYQHDVKEHGAAYGSYNLHDIQPDFRTADNEEFANYVMLRGKRDNGEYFWANCWDSSSLWSSTAWNYTHGRRVKYVEARDDVRTDEKLWSLAWSKLSQLSSKPRGAIVETDVIPSLKRGDIVRLSGATGGTLDDAGALNQRYLVVGFAHKWWRGEAARTNMTLKWVGSA